MTDVILIGALTVASVALKGEKEPVELQMPAILSWPHCCADVLMMCQYFNELEMGAL